MRHLSGWWSSQPARLGIWAVEYDFELQTYTTNLRKQSKGKNEKFLHQKRAGYLCSRTHQAKRIVMTDVHSEADTQWRLDMNKALERTPCAIHIQLAPFVRRRTWHGSRRHSQVAPQDVHGMWQCGMHCRFFWWLQWFRERKSNENSDPLVRANLSPWFPASWFNTW